MTDSDTHLIKVLLVEDNEDDYLVTRELLADVREFRYEVEWAPTYEAALIAIAQQQHDIYLLDYHLGIHNGLEVLQEAVINGCTAPIILLTGTAPRQIDMKAMQLGATDFLCKDEISTELLERTLRYAIRQNRSEEALRQQVERERLTVQIAQQIHQSLNLYEILDTTVTEIQQLLKADRVLVYRFEPDWSGTVIAESVVGDWRSLMGMEITETYFATLQEQSCWQNVAKPVNDVQTAGFSECHCDLLTQLQVQAHLITPILSSTSKLWGLLVVHQCSAPRQWQTVEVNLLTQLTTQVAIAIQQSALYQQLQTANQELQKIAALDELTQIPNRRYFSAHLDQELRRLAREQQSLSLILCDIDNFKSYNDTYGHLAGDECLRQIAQIIYDSSRRPADLTARYGGEEFAVILPNTDSVGAIKVVEKIREAIKQLSRSHPLSSESERVTLSFGITSIIPSCNDSPTAIVQEADHALCQAKALGRNQYYISQSANL